MLAKQKFRRNTAQFSSTQLFTCIFVFSFFRCGCLTTHEVHNNGQSPEKLQPIGDSYEISRYANAAEGFLLDLIRCPVSEHQPSKQNLLHKLQYEAERDEVLHAVITVHGHPHRPHHPHIHTSTHPHTTPTHPHATQ